MSRALGVMLAFATVVGAQVEAARAADPQPLEVAQMVRRKPKPTAQPEVPIPSPSTEPAPQSAPAAAPATAPASSAAPSAAVPATAQTPAATDEPRAEAPKMSGAKPVKFDRTQFRSDPVYKLGYDAKAQQQVYGGKSAMNVARPLVELGHPLYHEGPFGEGGHWLGRKNPTLQQVLLYGDWRGAFAYADDGIPGGDGKKANERVASRLNLDLDWKLTGTERVHFLFRPLDRKGDFTHYDFQGGPDADGKGGTNPINGNIVTGFLEGDLGAIGQGFSGHYNHLDLPFAIGLIPLQFQNGIWVDDAFTGFAASIPAMNSPGLDISNMDVTFFAGGDKVSLPGVLKQTDGKTPDDHHGRVLGLAMFAETHSGYFEGGYGYLKDDRGLADDASFHSLTAAFTRRYGGWLSNSVRVLGAFGQQKPSAGARSAGGALLLLENSLITRKPYTLIPYFNLFAGADTPQPLARDPGAGGVLRNVGMAFEADGLSGFPTLDASGRKAAGGALGLEYLFSLDQQLVVEAAGLQRTGSAPGNSSDYGLALRYQIPFARRFIFRFDAIGGRQGVDPFHGVPVERDISGARLELRIKF